MTGAGAWRTSWRRADSRAGPDQAADGLGVQEHQACRDPGAQRYAVVGDRPADQVQALALGDWVTLEGLLEVDVQAGHVLAGHRPGQEAADGAPVVFSVGGMPGVEAGMPPTLNTTGAPSAA